MRLRHVIPALLAAALLAPAALAQCPEPSALDMDPAAEPLRVEKAAGGNLRISWEAVTADTVRLHRGDLGRLHATGSYDHRVVAESPDGEVEIEPPDGPLYFVVNSDCRAGDSGVGRDSSGTERPYGGLVLVTIGLQGGMNVGAAQFVLLHPPARTFTETDWVTFIGPFADGAPGSPFGLPNASRAGEVRVAVLFGAFVPDPSFDPPPDMPLDITEVLLGYHGTAPTAMDFAIEECVISDLFGASIPETECVLSNVDVLF